MAIVLSSAVQRLIDLGFSLAEMGETDPVTLVEQTDAAEGFVEIQGSWYFLDPSGQIGDGSSPLSAAQLRIFADELDNRNGVGFG